MSDAWLACCFVSGILNVAFGLCVLARETAAEVSSAVQESLMTAYLAEERENTPEQYPSQATSLHAGLLSALAADDRDIEPTPEFTKVPPKTLATAV